MITQHTIARNRARGIKNWRFSTNISLYFENGTRYGHSYNGRPLTVDSFAVSCINLYRVGLDWVGSLSWRVGLGWVGSPKMDPRITLGGGHQWVLAKISSYLYPIPLSPPPRICFSLVAWNGILRWILWNRNQTWHFTIYCVPCNFFPIWRGGHSPLPPPPSCCAIGLSDGVWLMHGVRTFLISTSGDLII